MRRYGVLKTQLCEDRGVIFDYVSEIPLKGKIIVPANITIIKNDVFSHKELKKL